MQRAKEIFFFLPSLNGGGAERVVLTLLRHLDRSRFAPVLVLLQREGRYLDAVPTDIEVIDLGVSQVRYAPAKIIGLIRRRRPEILFTTLAHLNLIIALVIPFLRRHTRFIARESNTVSVRNRDENYPRIFDWLYRHIYRNYDLIITQARYMRDDLADNYGIPHKKMQIIYNPVDFDAIQQSAQAPGRLLPDNRINLLAAGRLDMEKGFDILLSVMHSLDRGFHLTILGEGVQKDALLAQCRELGLKDRVTFAGFVQNPYALMRQADLFLLPSRYEGLPNVLLEANACGTPVVAFDAPGGTGEIVTEGVNGFLVPPFDVEAFTATIRKAVIHPFDAETIRDITRRRFATEKIIRHYEALFEQL